MGLMLIYLLLMLWENEGNVTESDESVPANLSIPPNRTAIMYDGEQFMENSIPLKIPENGPAPCEACLICIAENAKPAAILHWELDGILFARQCLQSVSLTENGCYTTKLFFDGDLRQIADSSNLSCIAQQGNFTLSISVFVEWQRPHEWNIPMLRIALMVVLTIILVFTAVAFFVFLCTCSQTVGSTSSIPPAAPLTQARSLDNWTTNLTTKALLPEPPIINYDPEELEASKNPSLTSDVDTGACIELPDDNSSASSLKKNNRSNSLKHRSIYFEVTEPVAKLDLLDFGGYSAMALQKDDAAPQE